MRSVEGRCLIPRRRHSTTGTASGNAMPTLIAVRTDVVAASAPARIAAIGVTPTVHAVIAAFARPSTSRRSTVWRSVTAWMLNTTDRPSPISWCVHRSAIASACPRASGMHAPAVTTMIAEITIVLPRPRERAIGRARNAPAIEPTPPIAMITPNVACVSPSVRRQYSVYSAAKNPIRQVPDHLRDRDRPNELGAEDRAHADPEVARGLPHALRHAERRGVGSDRRLDLADPAEHHRRPHVAERVEHDRERRT